MALTTEELVVLNTSKINTQTTLDLMNQVFTYTSNYRDINANSDSDVSISYIDSNGVEQSYTVPTFYKMNTTFENLMSSLSDGNSYYIKTEVDTKDATIEAIAKRGGFKNYIINGGFDIWQRGNSFINLTSNAYIADRWMIEYRTNENLKAELIEYRGFNALRFTAELNDNSLNFAQRIENVDTLKSNTTYTLSLKARISNPKNALSGLIRLYFGTGGSAIIDYNINSVPLTTEFSKVVFTFTTGDLSAMQKGSNSYIQILLNFPLLQNEYGEITEVQMEVGDVATEFEHRPYGLELSLCQRYFEKSYDTNVLIGALDSKGRDIGSFTNPFSMSFSTIFKQTKRVTPTVTLYSPATGASGKVRDYTVNTDLTAIASDVGHSSFEVNGAGVFTTNNVGAYHWIADAEI